MTSSPENPRSRLLLFNFAVMNQGPLPSSFDGDTEFYEENRWQKLSRRLKEEPLIPLGCVLTCWALYGAAKSIRSGDSVTANQMFRKRLYAQAFTIIAMVGGSYYYKADRVRRKEFDNLVAERKAKEKNEKWIQELEARDREEKEWRAKLNLASAGKSASKEKQSSKQVVAENGQKSEGSVSKAVKELEDAAKESAKVVKRTAKEIEGAAKESPEAVKKTVKNRMWATEGKQDIKEEK